MDVIRKSMCTLSGVHHYDDIFEKWVRIPQVIRPYTPVLRRRIAKAIYERELLFIHVPKNAGTSIARELYGITTGHKSAQFYQAANQDFFDRAHPFAVLRDPVERFVSAYWFIRRGGGEHITVGEGSAQALAKLQSVDDFLILSRAVRPIFTRSTTSHGRKLGSCTTTGGGLVDRLFVMGVRRSAAGRFSALYGVAQLPTLNRTDKGILELTPLQLERINAFYRDDADLIDRVRTDPPGDGGLKYDAPKTASDLGVIL